ncbi:unnamed protein product [Chrysoparadoxa australica]
MLACLPVRPHSRRNLITHLRFHNQELKGLRTEVIVQHFQDRTFVVVSQLERIGTLLQVTSEGGGMGGKSFHVETLIGRRDDPLLVVCARQLAEQLRSDKPLLLGLALKDEGRDSHTFQAIINTVLAAAA